MNNLEQYIKEHRAEFDNSPMPNNHKELFLKKLESKKNTRLKLYKKGNTQKFIWGISSIAAAILIIVFIGKINIFHNDNISDNKLIENNYYSQMDKEEEEVITIVKRVKKRDLNNVVMVIKSIKEDAIPFTDLLPDEISKIEQEKIINDYYSKKLEGIKRFKTYYLEIEQDNN